MIAAWCTVAALLAAVAALAWTVVYPPRRPQHAGAGAGTLTVWQLVERVDTEIDSGGRHRLREPLVIRGDLADGDELATVETRLLPVVESGLPVDDRDAMARHPGMLRRLLVALQRL
ncbi:hypothetical protein [Saccharopolyspora sp. NPDC003762]